MIVLTHEQKEKIQLLDVLFDSMDLNQLRSIVVSEQVVAKLKGSGSNFKFLESIIDTNNKMEAEILTLQNDISSLIFDLKTLIKTIDKPFDSYNIQNFNNLKNKYGTY